MNRKRLKMVTKTENTNEEAKTDKKSFDIQEK